MSRSIKHILRTRPLAILCNSMHFFSISFCNSLQFCFIVLHQTLGRSTASAHALHLWPWLPSLLGTRTDTSNQSMWICWILARFWLQMVADYFKTTVHRSKMTCKFLSFEGSEADSFQRSHSLRLDFGSSCLTFSRVLICFLRTFFPWFSIICN